MTYTDVENSVYNWASLVLSIPVVFANENGPRPSLPYVILNIISTTKIGQAFKESFVGVDGIQTIKYDEDVNVSIQSYGTGGNNILQQLKDSLQMQTYRIGLNNDGLVIRDDLPIMSLSESIDDKMEKRYIYEVMFGFAQEITEEVGWIENTELDPTYLPPQ